MWYTRDPTRSRFETCDRPPEHPTTAISEEGESPRSRPGKAIAGSEPREGSLLPYFSWITKPPPNAAGWKVVMDSKLTQAMSDVTDSGRLGITRFVRCVATVEASADLSAVAESWQVQFRKLFGGETLRHVVSGDGKHALTNMTNWPSGQSTILIVGRSQKGARPGTDLMILGSKGAAYFNE